jgi:hydrogenase maturation protease
MRTLIGGVGYSYLRDGSLGPLVVDDLAREPWPDGVLVENLSYGPIAVMQRLQEAVPPFDRLILIAAVRRGRPSGALTVYRWDGRLPDGEEIQARVAEAVTGVISLDNLLVIAGFFNALPSDVSVLEVEPEDEGWGEGLSSAIEAARRDARETVRALVLDSWAPHAAMRPTLP